ncbi:MAG TPA: flagellar assembly peptidoglycan hydrolase FlgJ [Gammaproteobacteria bacterium]|nr:flagellar assembly peptidoglycan hydrolase FlgJ [Gammaproteobacteria bacterium]
MAIELAQVYTDFAGLGALRARAREDRKGALDEVARQFESLFTQMMLRSMRDASFGGGLLDSRNTEFYRDMYDQQLAVELSRQRGLGLAEVIKRQLGGMQGRTGPGRSVQDYRREALPAAVQAAAAAASERVPSAAPPAESAPPALDGTPETFVRVLAPAARAAARRLGLPPEALLAQAALETGWGAHVMRRPDGASSHNLFGIKADGRWSGERVSVTTLEYKDGVALKTRADFRAYNDWADSFEDYVRFVRDNPRYRKALQATDDAGRYFEELQRAGYATDPAYARKIRRILESGPLRTAMNTAGEGAGAG